METTAFANLAASKKRKDTKAAQAEMEEGRKLQEGILSALRPLSGKGVVKNREQFSEIVKTTFKKAGFKIPAVILKVILMVLAERDETADICTDAKGNPEPDPELRDFENIPLKADVDEYMKREVLPHVPDAWVDESKTKTGYEIPLTRYFFRYRQHDPIEQIEYSIKQAITALHSMIEGEAR
jgi:type I restriction enzyme M protein